MKLDVKRLGLMDYKEALSIQENMLYKRQQGIINDTLLLVEHPPVLTLGRRGKKENILLPKELLEQKGVSVYEVSRGGDITYHGPGQIVGYPIMDLRDRNRDIKKFVWDIEEVFIRLLKDQYEIDAHREEKTYTGVWVGKEKITAIGIAVKKWVTMHGFAFNANTNLDHFKWIVPCGLTDRNATSLQKLLGRELDMEILNRQVEEYFIKIFE